MIPTVKIKHPDGYAVINEGDFDAHTMAVYEEPEPITREAIGTMKKADVADLLDLHGADTSGTLPELRERLINVMFLEADE